MKKWSDLERRIGRLERGLGGPQERDWCEQFWAAMIGREEELYRRIVNLWPFEEAVMRLWNASLKDGQEGVDRVWKSLNPTQRTFWEAANALAEHVERRLTDFDAPEFDPSVWPEEVRKVVFEEVE